MGTYVGVFDKQTPTTPNQPGPTQAGGLKLYQGVYDENGMQTEPQGFFNWLKNVSINTVKTGSFLPLLDPTIFGNPKNYTDPQTLSRVRSDASKLFDGLMNVTGKGDPMSVAVAIGNKLAENQFARPTDNNSGGLGQLAIGFLKPVSDYMELNSGLSLTGNDIVALTPEEKATRIKSTVGLLAASAVAGPLAEALPTGNLARRMIGNTIAGTVTGATYGMVSSSGDKDAFNQIIQNGIFGGTLGIIHGTLFGRSAGKAKPSEIAQIRSLISPDNSIAESNNLARALMTSDDVAEALLTGKVGLKPNDIHIIPGVDPRKLGELNTKLPDGYRSAMHVDDAGVGRLLVYDEQLSGIDPNEKIVSAAIKVNGRYFEGPNHGEASRLIEKAGITENQINYADKNNWEIGFRTNNGRFVSDEEALRIGITNKQLPKDLKLDNIASEEFLRTDKNFGTVQTEKSGLRNYIKGGI
jgi:hypothetical protein